ncbi:MAG: hypothetical protein AABW64_01800 [Nanoarchaeota archaeon]
MGNLPIKKYRAGAIEGVIWLNKKRRDDGSEIEFKTATLRRSWKDREQNIWREEKINLRRTDLPKIAVIVHQLQTEMYLSSNNQEGGDGDE